MDISKPVSPAASTAAKSGSPLGMLLGFAPFIAFAVVEKFLGAVAGLACGTLVSVALLVHERLQGEREINILEAGSALLFGALTAWALLRGGSAWSVWQVRAWVDGGLLLVVLFGIATGRPFTLAHARRQVSAEVARSARFLRTNTILSCAWAIALAVIGAIDLLMVLQPETPTAIAIGLTLATLAAAALFTRWFAAKVQAEAKMRKQASVSAN